MSATALALAAGIPSLIGGIFGKSAHDKYAKQLEQTELELPGSMDFAEELYKSMSTQGLVGKKSLQEDIEKTIPTNINIAKENIDSPSALLGLLSQSQENVSGELRRLGIEDEAAKRRNKLALARFESRLKAPMEMNLDRMNTEFDLAAGQERMMGTKELLSGISEGVGSGISAFGQSKYLDYLKGLNENRTNPFGNDDELINSNDKQDYYPGYFNDMTNSRLSDILFNQF